MKFTLRKRMKLDSVDRDMLLLFVPKGFLKDRDVDSDYKAESFLGTLCPQTFKPLNIF